MNVALALNRPGLTLNALCVDRWMLCYVLCVKDLLNKQRLLFLLKKNSLEWIKKNKNSKPSQNE